MKSVSETLSHGRVIGLLFLLAFLSLVLGGMIGFTVGSHVEKQNSEVVKYAKLMYNTCKQQEATLYAASPQQKRRNCEYLLQAAKEQN